MAEEKKFKIECHAVDAPKFREWIKTRERNEALDLEVYCLAALSILGPGFVLSLPERAAALARRVEDAVDEVAIPGSAPRRSSGWTSGWRG